MEKTYYPMVAAGFVALAIVCLVCLLAGTYKTFIRMGIPDRKARRRNLMVAVVLLIWIGIASALAISGILSDFASIPPKFAIVIVAPLVSVVLLMRWPVFKNFLAHVPDSWLCYIQVFRVPVELFLWLLFLDNLIPVQMTFEGRNWDVLTGLTAPLAAYVCFGQGRKRRQLALIWNLVGMALLLNIISVAMLSTPSPFRMFFNEPANTIVATFPTVLLPALLVPIAYTMHLFSIQKILMRQETSAPATAFS
ncbi:hypothetical protein [Pontibacter roseus]|uniref:hypothetical protein n=1 Tax=Pontibacter roseus TaxID=336989 RepID=UPI000367EAFB|nr:hypothetical protein [Pontibacter roseus]